jgi:3-isopropylmalate/(R)-2-methylmalate dehydratase large subunit
MSNGTMLDKVWEVHKVAELDNGVDQLLVGLHLVHEVTSPQAFEMLRARGLRVRAPERTKAVADHIIPTHIVERPYADELAEEMMVALEKNCEEFGVELLRGDLQGIVHVIGPELGLTQPGMTITCGDSHTATHGALGTVAFGIGTSQVGYVLSSGCIPQKKPKVRRIEVSGKLLPGVYPKDVTLNVIHRTGAAGGTGYANEYGGSVVDNMSVEGRKTLCNMAIEGGAKLGYCLPDQKTVEYVRGRPRAPQGDRFNRLAEWWMSLRSDSDARYDHILEIVGEEIPPMITWGVDSGQSIPIDGRLPDDIDSKTLGYIDLKPGQSILGVPVNGAFLGSCTNGRIEDLREAARLIKEHGLNVASGVKAIVVPGSASVRRQAMSEGLDKIFVGAGYEWRFAGCSACLGMNPDKFEPFERVVSSSNRNYAGRQGKDVRTMLMSPAGVVYSAAMGKVSDVRELNSVTA